MLGKGTVLVAVVLISLGPRGLKTAEASLLPDFSEDDPAQNIPIDGQLHETGKDGSTAGGTTENEDRERLLSNGLTQRSTEKASKDRKLDDLSERTTGKNVQDQIRKNDLTEITTKETFPVELENLSIPGKSSARKWAEANDSKQPTLGKETEEEQGKLTTLSSDEHKVLAGDSINEGTNDPAEHENMALPLPAVAIPKSKELKKVAAPEDVTERETNQTDDVVITKEDCATDVAERLVREVGCVDEQWSCRGRCGQFRLLPCSCEARCHIYGTCCFDYHDQCLPEDDVHVHVLNVNGSTVLKVNTPPPSFAEPSSLLVPGEEGMADDETSVQLETPVGECSHRVMTRLISSCPRGTDSFVGNLCRAFSPTTLLDVTPVTDPRSKLHFRNIHCFFCWVLYWADHACQNFVLEPAAAWMRELIVCDTAPAQPIRWNATLFLWPSTTPPQFTNVSQVVTFLQTSYENVVWENPTEHPSYKCSQTKRHYSSCASCETRLSRNEHQPLNCDAYLSFVETSSPALNYDIYHENVHCLFCHLVTVQVNKALDSNKTGLGYSELQALAQSLECHVPQAGRLWPRFVSHSGTFSVLLSWSGRDTWSMSNVRATQALEDNSPMEGQMAWKQLRCNDDDGCVPLSCAPYSVLRDGVCTEELIPYTSVVTVCLMDSPNDTSCQHVQQPPLLNPQGHSRHGSGSHSFKEQLSKAILDALIEEAPWRFETGGEEDVCEQNTCELASYESPKGTTFVVWSQTSMKDAGSYGMEEEVVVNRVVRQLHQQGVQGWARVSFSDQPYRTALEVITWRDHASNSLLRYITSEPSGGAASVNQHVLIVKQFLITMVLALISQLL